MERQIRVRIAEDLYVVLSRLAVERKTSVSKLLCEGGYMVLSQAQEAARRRVPDAPDSDPRPCLDPDKMNGAGDQFPGTDEGSQYDPKPV
jgi:hypothetical protein